LLTIVFNKLINSLQQLLTIVNNRRSTHDQNWKFPGAYVST
jgi:hypothetical protein